MTNWLRRIRGAVGMGLIWGAVWAAGGALKAVDIGSLREMHAPWVGPPIGFFPGFVGGLIFSALIAFAAPRSLHELSVARAGSLGAVVGFLLGFLPLAINAPPAEFPVWLVAFVVIGSMTLMGVVSGAGSLALARRVRGRNALGDQRVTETTTRA